MNLIFEKIQNAATNKAITVGEDGFIRQYPPDEDNMRHLWKREHWYNSDLFKFIPRISGPHMVIDAAGGQLRPSDPLQIYPINGNQNQRWYIESASEPERYFIKADNSDLVWDVPYGNPEDGVHIQLAVFNGNENQKWKIKNTNRNVMPAIKIRPELSFGLGVRDLVLDVPGFSQDSGQQIQLYTDNGGFNQLWEITETSERNGKIQINSVFNGMVLTYPLEAAQANLAGTIIQSTNNNELNQQWRINELNDSNGDKIVNIVSALNGFFLTNAGIAILAFPDTHDLIFNQRWRLID